MKRAFSLIELLIVIAIISIFSLIAFSSLKKAVQKKDAYSIKNLKKHFTAGKYSELLCIDKCKKCYTRTLGSPKLIETKSGIPNIEAYIVSEDGNPQKIDFAKLNDHHICLRFIHYKNNSSTQMIIESKGDFFYFPSFFGETKKFDTLEGAARRWMRDSRLVSDQGSYYR